MDPDLEQRLERFEEDARVLVDIVKRGGHSSRRWCLLCISP